MCSSDLEEPVTLAKYLAHVYEDDREWIAESVRRAHDPAGDGRFDVEHRIVDRQGALHWLNTKSVTFFEGDGPARRKVRTVGAVADITERKRAEKALRDTNSMLQALIETSPLAIIGLDQEGTHVTRWNPAAERIFGWRADEVLGHPLPYIPDEDQARSLAMWEEATQTGVLTGRELRRLRKDGSLIDMALWSTALKDAQGAVTGTFSFIEIGRAHV